jgi:hypothetical protein
MKLDSLLQQTQTPRESGEAYQFSPRHGSVATQALTTQSLFTPITPNLGTPMSTHGISTALAPSCNTNSLTITDEFRISYSEQTRAQWLNSEQHEQNKCAEKREDVPVLRLVDPDNELGVVGVIKQETGSRIGVSTRKVDIRLIGEESSQNSTSRMPKLATENRKECAPATS